MHRIKNLWHKWKNLALKLGNFQIGVILFLFYFLFLFPAVLVVKMLDLSGYRKSGKGTFWNKRNIKLDELEEAKKEY